MRYRVLRLSMSRAFCASLLLGAGYLFAVPASAQQEMYPGEDVIVNPIPGSGVLLYPGGKYGRVQRQLLQPGAPYPGTNEAPIRKACSPRFSGTRARASSSMSGRA